MKYSKRYIIFTIIVCLAFLGKVNTWSDQYADVETFRGAQLEDDVFYPLKAKSVNDEGLLQLRIGEENYKKSDGVLMGDHMQPLASLDLAEELFGCRAVFDGEETIDLFHNSTKYRFTIGAGSYRIGDNVQEMASPAELHDDVAYLPLMDLCAMFQADYAWNDLTYVLTVDEDYTMGRLPARFDLRSEAGVSRVRDQGSESTCWAQAALTALESSLLPAEEKTFDVDCMTKDNQFDIEPSLGGEYSMAVAYFLSWRGPVEEESREVEHHVQEVHFFDQDDMDQIKWAVYQKGGVTTSIYANVTNSNLSRSSYYNKKTNAYAYLGDSGPNHDVVIIGWDDKYSARNFSEEVPGDGAFICQNSWGTSFGDGGVFYVSYYDTNIGNQSVSYAGIEKSTNYDRIYQSDLCGWVGQVGYNKEKIHAANVYTAQDREEIVSAGFYALGSHTTYQIFVVENFRNEASLANRVAVAEGTLQHAGYYTISFDRGITVEEGEKFAIVLVLNTPGSVHPMAMEYASNELTAHVDIGDGQGYISNNGLDWESVEEMAEGNLCLKAYSRKLQEEK